MQNFAVGKHFAIVFWLYKLRLIKVKQYCVVYNHFFSKSFISFRIQNVGCESVGLMCDFILSSSSKKQKCLFEVNIKYFFFVLNSRYKK